MVYIHALDFFSKVGKGLKEGQPVVASACCYASLGLLPEKPGCGQYGHCSPCVEMQQIYCHSNMKRVTQMTLHQLVITQTGEQ